MKILAKSQQNARCLNKKRHSHTGLIWKREDRRYFELDVIMTRRFSGQVRNRWVENPTRSAVAERVLYYVHTNKQNEDQPLYKLGQFSQPTKVRKKEQRRTRGSLWGRLAVCINTWERTVPTWSSECGQHDLARALGEGYKHSANQTCCEESKST